MRVLLLDPDDRVLLLRGLDPAVPETTWWITPGGGLEPGEGAREAALRELGEEIGLADVELGPVVAYGTVSFSFQGQAYEQEQWFHLARTGTRDIRLAAPGSDEHARLLAVRWWTVGELRDTPETVYPAGLTELVEQLVTDGPPVPPVRL
ncbi:NUDIX domain-containing protein [Kitasatospora sp. NPDC051914]|uniref:NUDIX domain-containing protein n=1 Tax=Kitasatospora sp. NPDC051914 TaxID=3154945 RepID=UPI0034246646